MLTTLLESRAVRTRKVRSTAMSVVLHGALIAGALLLTNPGQHRIEARDGPMMDPVYVPVTPSPPPMVPTDGRPASRVPTFPHPVDVDFLPVGLPSAPSFDFQPAAVDELPSGGVSSPGPQGALGTPGAGIPGSVVDEAYVEKIPTLIGSAPAPRFPDALRASGVSGHVVVRFVVDTLGRAELDGAQVVEASHPLFADAVRNALGRYRFAPGEAGGHKVRTLVQMPFTFTVR